MLQPLQKFVGGLFNPEVTVMSVYEATGIEQSLIAPYYFQKQIWPPLSQLQHELQSTVHILREQLLDRLGLSRLEVKICKMSLTSV